MSIHTSFQYSIDILAIDGETVIEHLAAVEDFCVALATYRAACDRWPGAAIALRQGGANRGKADSSSARHVRPFVSASCVRWLANAQLLPVYWAEMRSFRETITGFRRNVGRSSPLLTGPILMLAREEINFSSTGNRIAS
jgi:hypothetical protein